MNLIPAELQQPRRFLALVIIASVVVSLVLAFQARHRVYKRMLLGSHEGVNDFQRWVYLTPKFLAGEVHYDATQKFSNPPITLLVFAAFNKIPPHNGQFVWVICKSIFCWGILLSCLGMVRNAGMKITPLAATLALSVWMWPVFIDMQEGQTNLLMLLPLASGLYLCQSPGVPTRLMGGLLIALAICIKVTPLIFVLYFLWRRRWLEVLGVFAGLILWLWVVPGLAFGWERNSRWLAEYFRVMIVPYVAHGTVKAYFGQSLPSFITRLLRHVPAFDHSGPPVYVNLVDWPEATVNWIARIVLGTIALAGAWWMRRPLASMRSPRYIIEIGCVAVFMVFASQQSWVPHYVSMVFALSAAAMVLSSSFEEPEHRHRVRLAFITAFFLMLMTSDAAKVLGRDGGEYMRTVGVSIWACLLLVAATVTSRCARLDVTQSGDSGTEAAPISDSISSSKPEHCA